MTTLDTTRQTTWSQSLERGLAILSAFGSDRATIGVSELSRDLGHRPALEEDLFDDVTHAARQVGDGGAEMAYLLVCQERGLGQWIDGGNDVEDGLVEGLHGAAGVVERRPHAGSSARTGT